MIVEERRTLAAPAGMVVDFFEHLDRHYLDWHPDHVSFDWLNADRTAFHFDERIGRWRVAMRMTLERGADGSEVSCRPMSFWLRLVMPWMTFQVTSTEAGSVYLHRINLRLGPLRPLLRRTLLDPLHRHMRDESAFLDRLGDRTSVA